ncbi:hypothetical protein B4113_3308 [Geobacillus sp. B4113_201601]|nr:hypothetical protein B4113_3308 [Geobacillus sp. B4113_201601]
MIDETAILFKMVLSFFSCVCLILSDRVKRRWTAGHFMVQ